MTNQPIHAFMKIRLFVLSLWVSAMLFSCTSDSPANDSEDVVIDHYTQDNVSNYTDSGYIRRDFTTGNIVNNKKYSLTTEVFINGVSQGSLTEQHYFFSGDKLSSIVFWEDVRNFYYDGNGDVTGITRQYPAVNGNGVGLLYYQFVPQPGNVVFCNRMTLPMGNPDTQISHRVIMEFDENDNVVDAGRDDDLDGVIDHLNHFIYDGNDLVSIQFYNGGTASFNYSDVVNTAAVLDDNTLGKKVRRLLCCEDFAGPTFSYYESEASYSQHLTQDEFASGMFEVSGNNFYSKKTVVNELTNPTEQFTSTREFFFN